MRLLQFHVTAITPCDCYSLITSTLSRLFSVPWQMLQVHATTLSCDSYNSMRLLQSHATAAISSLLCFLGCFGISIRVTIQSHQPWHQPKSPNSTKIGLKITQTWSPSNFTKYVIANLKLIWCTLIDNAVWSSWRRSWWRILQLVTCHSLRF